MRSLYSLISTGTELMKVGESKMSLVSKARARPDQVKKVLDTAYQQGPLTAYKKAMNRLDSYTPLGYSLAGVVVEVGRAWSEFSVGQVVACAGNEFAFHAELNWVPTNLCVAVPDAVEPRLAAFATVGAIAMQGVRQGDAQIGDTACVIGLGLVGQLVVRLLVASGVQVVGLDVVAERCALAEKAGAVLCAAPDEEGLAAVEQPWPRRRVGWAPTGCSWLPAGPPTSRPRWRRDWHVTGRRSWTSASASSTCPGAPTTRRSSNSASRVLTGPGATTRSTRSKGWTIPPATSAGPNDATWRASWTCSQEVRSTSSRSWRGFFPRRSRRGLRAAAPATCPVSASSSSTRDPMLLQEPPESSIRFRCRPEVRTNAVGRASCKEIGFGRRSGKPADRVHRCRELRDVDVVPPPFGPARHRLAQRVATVRSLSAVNAQRKFGFTAVGTDAEAVLADDSIDAVFIVTRHSSHAESHLPGPGGRQGRVRREAPGAAVSRLDRSSRRWTPPATTASWSASTAGSHPCCGDAGRFRRASEPTVARYLVNAGPVARPTAGTATRSRRVALCRRGRALRGHDELVDRGEPVEVTAQCAGGRDDLQVTLRYGDGSLGTITYLVNGHPRFPKETFEVFSGGRSARLDNFRRATVWAGRRRRDEPVLELPRQGPAPEVGAFLDAVRSGAPMPIPLGSLVSHDPRHARCRGQPHQRRPPRR